MTWAKMTVLPVKGEKSLKTRQDWQQGRSDCLKRILIYTFSTGGLAQPCTEIEKHEEKQSFRSILYLKITIYVATS